MKAAVPRIGRLQVGVFVAVVLLLAAFSWTVKLAEDYYASSAPDRSVFNSAPMGLSIWYLYLEELGLSPKVVRSFDELPPESVLVVAGPFEVTPSEAEGERLQRWIEEGGRLVLVGYEADTLTLPLGLGVGPSGVEEGERLVPRLPSIYTTGIEGIDPGSDRLSVSPGPWVSHYGGGGFSALISRSWGDGAITWLGSPYAVSNEGISEAENAELAVLLAGSGDMPVYFDEYHHGYSSDQGIWDRLDASGRWVTVFAVLAVAVLISAHARRLGPAIPVRETPVARTTAYIATLAELYRRAGARGVALGSLEEGLKRSLVHRHGSLDGGLARHASAEEALRRSGDLRTTDRIDMAGFLAAARELRRARQEVEGRDG